MRRGTLGRGAAIAAYCAYWALGTFDYLSLDRSDAPQLSREVFYAVTIGGPAFLVGAALARWWAPAVGLIFVAMLPLGERCVTYRDAPDAVVTWCTEHSVSDLPIWLALTTPFVLAGVVAMKLLLRLRSTRRTLPS
jgi:hypothetical protein